MRLVEGGAHVAREPREARREGEGGAAHVGEDEGEAGEAGCFAGDDEVGDGFECLVGDLWRVEGAEVGDADGEAGGQWWWVRYLCDGDAEQVAREGRGGGRLGAVEEDDGVAPVQLFPDRIEDVVAEVFWRAESVTAAELKDCDRRTGVARFAVDGGDGDADCAKVVQRVRDQLQRSCMRVHAFSRLMDIAPARRTLGVPQIAGTSPEREPARMLDASGAHVVVERAHVAGEVPGGDGENGELDAEGVHGAEAEGG